MCDSYDRPHSSLRFGTDTLCVRFSRSISFACVTETRSLTNARRIVENIGETTLAWNACTSQHVSQLNRLP